MQIDVAVLRQGQHPRGNDAPIANDDDRVRAHRLKLRAEVSIALDLLRLSEGESMSETRLLHGRRRKLQAAAARPVRLRDYQTQVMSCLDQTLEGRHRELRRAAEN